MLTDEETDAVCRTWHSKTDTEKDAVLSELRRLRRIAHERPAFRVFGYESWRQNSEEIARDISENWEVGWVGAAPAIEAAVLEKLLFSQRVEAWDRACQILQLAANDPAINSDPDAWSFFRHLRDAVLNEADSSDTPSRWIVRSLLDDGMRKQIHSEVGREHGKKPHVKREGVMEQVREKWMHLDKQGFKKNKAAPVIADELHLAQSTVRKKLQGL